MKENIQRRLNFYNEIYTGFKGRKLAFQLKGKVIQGPHDVLIDLLPEVISNPDDNVLITTLRKEAGFEILDFLSSHFSLINTQQILFTSKCEKLREQVDYNNLQVIINLEKVNTHKDINQWFRSINKLLPDQGFYAGCVETYDNRKNKINRRYGNTIATVVCFADFIFNRVLSRLQYTKRLYNFVTKNKYKALSLAETLGRFVYCGFEIIDFKEINGLKYFVVKKSGEPKNCNIFSEALIFPMNRIGKNGKVIKVYKLRTMHPYSEFLQDFIIKRNGYNHLGKPANDFRLTAWGRIFRKLWLDEIPQIINVLKGDLAIVGVRPLSQVRFSQFPEDLKEERLKHKPGCIPPYVALCMPDSIGNIEAERIYLREKSYDPYFTNLKYFLMAIYNIITNKIRSN
jgi:Bacterial sugar transferase